MGTCIIGGPLYRGYKWSSELHGKVIFGDNVRGSISTYTPGGKVEQLIPYIGGSLYTGLSNFAVGSDGEIYMLKLGGRDSPFGTILKLAKEVGYNPPPRFLSQTKLFQNMTTLEPAYTLISYEVGSPLWSDGAEKKRWFFKPKATFGIATSISSNWIFPRGYLLVKHFVIVPDKRHPDSIKRLETRVFVICGGGVKYGLTYKWNDEGTDAELLYEGDSEILDIIEEDVVQPPK